MAKIKKKHCAKQKMSIKDNRKIPLKGSLKELVASDRTVAWQHNHFRLIVEFGYLEFKRAQMSSFLYSSLSRLPS